MIFIVIVAACDNDSASSDQADDAAGSAESNSNDLDPTDSADSGELVELDADTDTGSSAASCESLYAAALGEALTCSCDAVFESGADCQRPSESLPDSLCVDSESPNGCARRLYDSAETAVGFSDAPDTPRAFVARYLPRCQNGSDECAGQEVRCTDGTRPAVYAQRAHNTDHEPVDSTVWVVSMGGEGGPCGGEVSVDNASNCWAQYLGLGGAAQTRSISSKTPGGDPPQSRTNRGGLQQDWVLDSGEPNPFHGTNRVLLERCGTFAGDGEESIHPTNDGTSTYPGPTTVYHHGFRTAATLFHSLTTDSGRDFGDGSGGTSDGDADDLDDLPNLAGASLILVTGSSDAGRWLVHGADRIAQELGRVAPDAEVRIVIDSIIDPMLENEFRHRYPYDEARDINENGENDIFDHIADNPDELRAEHADTDHGVYGPGTYQDGGRQRNTTDAYQAGLDASCVETHSDDPWPCYDIGHTLVNHVETPFMIVMDHGDRTVRVSDWAGTFNSWPDSLYAERINSQGRDMAQWTVEHGGEDDPTTADRDLAPGFWMANRGWHVHMLNTSRLTSKLHLCDDDGAVVGSVSLIEAIDQWMRGEAEVDAVLGHRREPAGLTWFQAATCER